jgi:hypothetical protein
VPNHFKAKLKGLYLPLKNKILLIKGFSTRIFVKRFDIQETPGRNSRSHWAVRRNIMNRTSASVNLLVGSVLVIRGIIQNYIVRFNLLAPEFYI